MAYRVLFLGLLAAAWALFPTTAHAEEPAVGAPLPPPTPPPSPRVVVGEHTCVVGEHGGLDDADARTTCELVCEQLVLQKAPAGVYDIRFGKLGRRVYLTVSERATSASRRVLIQSLDEVPVATPRLVAALLEKKTLAETQNVDNVVSSDSRRVGAKSSMSTSVDLTLVGLSGIGFSPSASAGVGLGIMFRSGRLSMGSHLRGGGASDASNKIDFVGIDFGVRYHVGDGDTAPFVGGGVAYSYLKVNRNPVSKPTTEFGGGGETWDRPGSSVDLSPSCSGLGAFVEAGVELFRSSHVGATLSLRVDAPFYVLQKEATLGNEGEMTTPVSIARYVVPISLNMGFRFQ